MVLLSLLLFSYMALALGFGVRVSTRAVSRRSLSTVMKARISVSDVLASPKFPEKWPYTPRDFSRQDESTDTAFYAPERLLYHIDDKAVQALTKYYAENIAEGSDVLDICSSWVSHYPKNVKLGRVSGLGGWFI